ncbi:LacI family DNA-binding transcriptional regulator [Streptomyces sp. SID335]|uniref:HTH tetR-type domain-containing protein n=1 Tax=Streptomyces venezuelae TaxID=54571 RepID=A0A5P2BKI3_STRVZ|nr:LacI family DNA-binding transcriptional regulator [Streptomyces sp. SID335]MYZ17140.1 LacI family DNA-binding transcriptional regulator [Streptomyces sp. SID337]NDZ88985.1 LacI family transcriptional regulator [Streptomyces sp. SID10115]NDZ98253.1 LacI family transcriptional regulator [Streptomyces sp. SID10116]NEB46946.1 LacI family transcriptional regulator [Streptomyces sp. SID339]QES30944.1 hypothetical protein DEJ47_35055 [Streptomyces venezuelae]
MTERGEQRLTIRDVAARAGVPRGAVSPAFDNKPGVSEATRTRIVEVVLASRRVAAHQVPTPALTPRGSTGPPPGRE